MLKKIFYEKNLSIYINGLYGNFMEYLKGTG